MNRARSLIFVLAIFVCPLLFGAALCAQEFVSLPTRPGVTQSYFLVSLPRDPQAIAVLFPGSGGLIRLRREEEEIRFSTGNFLVRSRADFVKLGAITAIIDAPSDRQSGWGMPDEFRLDADHFTDMGIVVGDLKKKFPDKPLFLIGTSRGTISAAALGARFGQEVAGVVLTSSMFRPAGPRSNEPGPGLSGFDFGAIKAPVLIVHHVNDQCGSTPYGDAARLADKYPLISVAGGLPPKSGPCDAFSAHGYLGKESETVEEIVNWMLKKPYQQDVK